MQFRQQAGRKRIEVLSYRGDKPVLVGSIDPQACSFKPSKTNGVLTSGESREVESFLETQRRKNAEAAVAALPAMVNSVTKFITENKEEAKALDVKALYRELPRLAKALTKTGLRTPKGKSKVYKPLKGETILFDD